MNGWFSLVLQSQGRHEKIILVSLIVCLAVSELLYNYFGRLPAQFYTLLPKQERSDLLCLIGKAGMAVLAIACMAGITEWLHQLYSIQLRSSITQMIPFHDCAIDNPDQRRVEDVKEFARECSRFTKLLWSPVLIGYYSWMAASRLGWWCPIAIWTFFVITALCMRLLLRPLTALLKQVDGVEGDYRNMHQTMARYSETIQMERGIGAWRCYTLELFNQLAVLLRLQSKQEGIIMVARKAIAYSSAILNYLFLTMVVLCRANVTITAAMISESSFVCLYLIGKLTEIVEMADSWARLQAYGQRIVELQATEREASSMKHASSPVIRAIDIAVATPTGRLLFDNLSFSISPGQNVLISGPNGVGKTSLIRALMGSWPLRSGEILMESDGRRPLLICLPQGAVKPPGRSMAEQICYPDASTANASEIHKILSWLELEPRVDFGAELSPGEEQRLAVGRLFWHRPYFAILDEAMTFVDPTLETRIYQRLHEQDITTITISHRSDNLRHFIGQEINI